MTDAKEAEAIAPLLLARFADMPAWAQAEYAEKQRAAGAVYVRIRPARVTGRRWSAP